LIDLRVCAAFEFDDIRIAEVVETECGRLALSSSSIPTIDSNRLSQLTIAESHINFATVVTWKAGRICDPNKIFMGTQAQSYTELQSGKK
jgi:hypothetical protein